MIEKEFTLYPEAFELNQLGFDEPCFKYIYTGDTGNNVNIPCEVLPSESKNYNEDALCVSTPTYSQAFRWFREKYNLDLSINTVYTGYNELTTKNYSAVVDDCGSFTNVGFYKTYEEAELACLKKLIEIVKERRN